MGEEMNSYQTICMFIIEFFLFSCAGWLLEVVLKWIQYHKFINRGFLIGPYCPIYGWGAIVVTILVGGLIGREGTIAETFFAGLVICGGLEYLTSWFMEKMFHARWWDYSQKPMNLHGRIWIGNLLLFGAAAVVIVKWMDPLLLGWLQKWPSWLLECAALMIVVVMVTDHIVSSILMNLVKKEIDTQQGDSTAEISRKIHELLKDRSLLLRRIHEAFPNLQAHSKRMVLELKQAHKTFRAADREWKATTKQAAKAALGKLKKPPQGASDLNWKAKVEQATKAKKAAKKTLRDVEKRFFLWRDEDE